MGWFWTQFHGLYKWEQYQNYLPENLKTDPVLRFLDKYPDLLQLIFGAGLFVAGFLIRDSDLGVKFVLYGVFVKTVIVLLAANAVDVVNHAVGYRNYETGDLSTNSWLMAILHLGGAISWHNNHHALPQYFSVRRKWWEFDVHRLMLRVLEKLGLVWDIRFHDEVG
jgi:stearoyl-CoA desaturase (delta-9 desaturase)